MKKVAILVVLAGLFGTLFFYSMKNERKKSNWFCDWRNPSFFKVCLEENYLGSSFDELSSVLVSEEFVFAERPSASDPHYFRKRANNLANYIVVALIWVGPDGVVSDIEVR